MTTGAVIDGRGFGVTGRGVTGGGWGFDVGVGRGLGRGVGVASGSGLGFGRGGSGIGGAGVGGGGVAGGGVGWMGLGLGRGVASGAGVIGVVRISSRARRNCRRFSSSVGSAAKPPNFKTDIKSNNGRRTRTRRMLRSEWRKAEG